MKAFLLQNMYLSIIPDDLFHGDRDLDFSQLEKNGRIYFFQRKNNHHCKNTTYIKQRELNFFKFFKFY